MSQRRSICAFLAGLVILMGGCRHYSSVSERRPSHHSTSRAGEIIARAMRHPASPPLNQIGGYLDAAASAGAVLQRFPDAVEARSDYNFAVGRIFESLSAGKLEPWVKPIRCPGSEGSWTLSFKASNISQDPAHFRILPADQYIFRGSLIKQRVLKDGLGAPLVAASKDTDFTRRDRFAQGKNAFYGLTGIVTFNGRNGEITLFDPLATEEVSYEKHPFPLRADFTAPLAFALTELKPVRRELLLSHKAHELSNEPRLARLQPYDPRKIPILCIHGLGDSHATWVPLIETLRGDATIRQNFQFWFFSYPTCSPYPLMAAELRKQMDVMDARYPNHKPMIVIGHSMGGMIARELMTDSGMKLWNAYFDQAPAQLSVSPETRQVLKDALIFKPRDDIARVIFASTSHRGSEIATKLIARLSSTLIGHDHAAFGGAGQHALEAAGPISSAEFVKDMPNSIHSLDPRNRFVVTINQLPLSKKIPFHSIIGDRGRGGNHNQEKPVSTDGIVPYWSSHLAGAQSEIIVPSGHWTHQHPIAIAEIRRILLMHLER